MSNFKEVAMRPGSSEVTILSTLSTDAVPASTSQSGRTGQSTVSDIKGAESPDQEEAPPSKKIRIELPKGITNAASRAEDTFIQSMPDTSGTSVSVEDLQTLLSQQDPEEEEMSFPIRHSDRKYINCDYTIANSVGAVFAKSLHRDRKPDHVQGRI